MSRRELPAWQRCLIWTITVIAFTIAGLMLAIPFQHETAHKVFVSSEFALAGFLIVIAGLGDLLCRAIEDTMLNLGNGLLLLGCVVSAVSSIADTIYLQGRSTPSTADYRWAIGVFVFAALTGMFAVFQAARS